MATEGTQKVRRLVAKLNKLSPGEPASWLTADALKTLCQEIESQDRRIEGLEEIVAGLVTEVRRLSSPSRDLIGPGPAMSQFNLGGLKHFKDDL